MDMFRTLIDEVVRFFSPVSPQADVHLPLIIVAVEVMALLFVLLLVLRTRQATRMRAAVAVVVGGWGQSGRSEVEEMKAALFLSMGHDCIMSGSDGFRYRAPWGGRHSVDFGTDRSDEQKLAETLGSQVLLFEGGSIGAQAPHQQEWLKPSFTTLTPTYADGIDIQAPVRPIVEEHASKLVPPEATCISTEEEMLPILRRAAEQTDSRVFGVNSRLTPSKENGAFTKTRFVPQLSYFPKAKHCSLRVCLRPVVIL